MNKKYTSTIKKTAVSMMICSLTIAAAATVSYAAPEVSSSKRTISYSDVKTAIKSEADRNAATNSDLTVNSTDQLVVSSNEQADAATVKYAYTPITTMQTDPSSRFGAGRMTMYDNHDSSAQNLSVIFETPDAGLIVVDGGWGENGESLYKEIKAKGGHVGAWLITHPHQDHALALADVLNKHAGDIKIDGIYYSFLDDAWYQQCDPESAGVLSILKPALAKLPAEKLHGDIKAGQQISVGSAVVQVVNDPMKFSTNSGNNSGVCYTVSMNGTNVLFLGDLGLAAGAQLMEAIDLKSLNIDLCQVAHHGQEAVSYAFYQRLAPRGFLWPTPQWLWDNDNGGGPGSGKWSTGTTRKWQSGLLIRENYVTKDGDQIIE